MNISTIVASACFMIAMTPGKNLYLLAEKNDLPNKSEVLNEFDFSARTITNCSKSECIEASLKKVRNMNSYLLVYKSEKSWIVENNAKKRDAVISNYTAKQISVATGNVVINNEAIKEDYLVVLSR